MSLEIKELQISPTMFDSLTAQAINEITTDNNERVFHFGKCENVIFYGTAQGMRTHEGSFTAVIGPGVSTVVNIGIVLDEDGNEYLGM